MEVSEDAEIGSLIGNLPLERDFSYRCVRCPKEISVDLISGELRVASELDRESGNGSLSLVLTSTQPSILQCTIRLLDANDNSPTFALFFQNVSIAESAPLGTRTPLVAATDPDQGDNGRIIRYFISPTEKSIPFDVQDNSGILYLVLNSTLDRELKDQYVFNISAVDAGQPSRMGNCTVHVQVLDVNDNTPTVENKTMNISWNGIATSPIITLLASDADVGLNGHIVFRVLGEEAKYFDFKENVLYSKLNNPPCCSRSICHQCILSILVSDQGGPPLSTVVSVTVDIQTANLHDPVITMKLFPSTVDFAVVDSDTPAGKTLAVFTMSDEEGPLSDDSLQITAGNEEAHFILSGKNQFAVLKLAVNGSRLLKSLYELEFTCSDGQHPPRITKKTLKVYAGTPEHIAFRAPTPQSVRISRSSDIGTFVAVVKENNTGCQFRLENENAPFTLDEISGIITTQGGLADIGNRYSLYIKIFPPPPAIQPMSTEVDVTIDDVINESRMTSQVKVNRTGPHSMEIKINSLVPLGVQLYKFEGGFFSTSCPGLVINEEGILSLVAKTQANQIQCEVNELSNLNQTDSDAIRVFLLNENRDQNIRLNRSYTFWVDELTPLATVIGRVASSDLLIFSSPHQNLIGIFPDGVVYVRRNIDRLHNDLIILPIEAKHRVLNSTFKSTVYIYVNDINNHAPRCANQQFHIKENEPLLSRIGQIACADKDFNLNSALKYRIIDDKRMVEIGAATGIIRSLAVFDAEKLQNFSISVEVSDLAAKSLNALVNLTIFIDDVNDNEPVFTQKYQKIEMTMDSNEIMERVGQVMCIDNDITQQHSEIEYGLENFQNIFEINHKTGEIFRTEFLPEDHFYNTTVFCQNTRTSFEDPEESVRTHSFILLSTDYNRTAPPIIKTKDDVILISPSALVGSIIGQISVQSPVPVHFSVNDTRLDVDTWGNIILTCKPESLLGSFIVEFTVASISGLKTVHIQHFQRMEGKDHMFTVKGERYPIVVTSLMEDATVMVIEPPTASFQVKDRKLLMLSGDESNQNYALVIREKGTLRLLKVTHITTSSNKTPICNSKVTVLHKRPHTVTIHCESSDVIISSPDENKNVRMTGKNRVEIVAVDGSLEVVQLTAYDRSLTYSTIVNLTIISDQIDSAISFPSNKYSLLLSSSHQIDESFGRITADSDHPLQYFVIGPAEIGANRFTGELILLGNVTKDVHLTMIALSQTGIASVEVFIELVEDSLDIRTSVLILSDTISKGKSVGTVDIGRDDVIFVLENTTKFKMNGAQITPKENILCEDNLYELSLEVRKGRLSAPMKVFIVCLQTAASSMQKEFFVRENAPAGTVFGRLPGREYRISDGVDFITVDSDMYLKTAKVFNFEEKDVYSFNVTHSDVIIQVELFIDDENDNPPIFPKGNYEIQVAENVEIGKELWKFRWEDPDLNNIFDWEILEGNEYDLFQLESDGILRLKNSLDRETTSQHRIVVQLRDGIAPYAVHSSNCSLLINVLDVNDNAPQLTSSVQFFLFENSAKGTVIGGLTAFDADNSFNSQFSFRILPDSLSGSELIVDPVYGHLIVNSDIDYEKKQKLMFILEIYDFGSPSQSSYWPITVFVIDENDNIPEFQKSSRVVSVRETTIEPGVIHTFEVNDKDSADNALSFYRILGDSGPFEIGALTGQLHVRGNLDYETTQSYNLTIAAQNIAGGRSASRQITVNIMDENDEEPQFILGSPVSYEIYENMVGPYPLVIALSVAEDSDEGLNGKISYSMLDGNTSKFSVNSVTGEIASLEVLDREEASTHWLTVKAMDSGTPRLSSTTDIKITVLDANDNVPMFNVAGYRATVTENAAIGTRVIQLNATDADVAENAKIKFSIVGGPVPFTADPDTGWITISDSIDRERSASYAFEVKAEDQGRFTRHFSLVTVFIDVRDVNFNAPLIRNSQLDVLLPNNLKKDELVYIVDVFDADGGPLYFNLTGMDAKMFYINKRGEIRLRAPSISGLISTTLTVTAYDEGGLTTSNGFTFYFTDPERFPICSDSLSHLNISEGIAGELYTFHATSAVGPLQYSILAGNNGEFEIDPGTGMLQLIKPLDYEEAEEIYLWIATTINSNPPLSCLKNVRISVEDVNDNTPIFQKMLYTGHIIENSDRMDIVQVNATDADRNGERLKYSIVEGNEQNLFEITQDGIIQSTISLDREEMEKYRLIVEASDALHVGRTAVEIYVLDEDDNGPKFPRIFHSDVREDLPVGSLVMQVVASDVDGHSNHSYSIEEDDTPFQINRTNGEVTLKLPLDREKIGFYRIPIRVEDGYNSISTNLQITVEDVNDNNPLFHKNTYILLAEDTGPIGFVNSSDADISLNGELFYSISKESSYVSINTTTGEIELTRRPPSQFINLTVVASDRGFPRRSSNVSVILVNKWLLTEEKTLYLAPNKTMQLPKTLMNAQIIISQNDSVVIENNTIRSDGLLGEDSLIAFYSDYSCRFLSIKFSKPQPKFLNSSYEFPISRPPRVPSLIGSIYIHPRSEDVEYSAVTPSHPFQVTRNGDIVIVGGMDHTQSRYNFTVVVKDTSADILDTCNVSVLLDRSFVPLVVSTKRNFVMAQADTRICPEIFEKYQFYNVTYATDNTGSTMDANGCIFVNGGRPPTLIITATSRKEKNNIRIDLVHMNSWAEAPHISQAEQTTDKENVTVNVRPLAGTILFEADNHISMQEDADLLVAGNRLLTKEGILFEERSISITERRRFSRNVNRHLLSISPIELEAAPVLPAELSTSLDENTVTGTVVVDQRISVPSHYNIHLIGEHSKDFCVFHNGSIVMCGPIKMQRSPYLLNMEISSANHTVSSSHVTIHVTPSKERPPINLTGYIKNAAPYGNILKIPAFSGVPSYFRILDPTLRKKFFISPEGVLSHSQAFFSDDISVMHVQIVLHPEGSSKTTPIHVTVLVDDAPSTDLPTDPKFNIVVLDRFNPIKNVNIFPRFSPAVQSVSCLPQRTNNYQINATCFLTVRSVANAIEVSAQDGNTWMNYSVSIKQLNMDGLQDSSLVRLDIVASEAALGRLLNDMEERNSDLMLVPVSVVSNSVSSHTVYYSINDLSNRPVSPHDSHSVIHNFFNKSTQTHYILEGLSVVECKSCIQCLHNQRTLRWKNQLWVVGQEAMETRDCSSVEHTTKTAIVALGVPRLVATVTNETCRSESCQGGICIPYRTGYQGDCGEFIASACLEEMTTVSLSEGYVELIPKESLLDHLQTLTAPLECNTTQTIVMDIRIDGTEGNLLTFYYGSITANVEIVNRNAIFRLTDGYRNLAALELQTKIQAGQWHRISLKISEDLKELTFRIDQVGRVARSAKPLPALISTELKRITVGEMKNRKSPICVRRLIISGQLQSLRQQSRPPNQLFTTNSVGVVSSGCSTRDAQSASLISSTVIFATAGVIMLIILPILICITVKCTSRKNNGKCKEAWRHSEEIVAATIPTNKVHSFSGQSNLAMTSSMDSDIYDVAYHHTPTLPMRRAADRNYSNPVTSGVLTVADVQLDMLRTRSHQV